MPTGMYTDMVLSIPESWTTWTTLTTVKEKDAGEKILPGIKHIQFNEKAGTTTIVWNDGSDATVVHCGKDEQFEHYVGFCAAICKKLFKSTSAVKKLIHDLDCDVIKAQREQARLDKAQKQRELEERNRTRKRKKLLANAEEALSLLTELLGIDMDYEKEENADDVED